MPRFFRLWLPVWMALAIAACRLAAGEPELVGEIRIGATLPLTGEFGTYGQSAYYGAMTGVKAINAAGGVNGKRLVVQWRDNRSDPELTVRQIEEFAEKFGAPAVIGPLFSDSLMLAAPAAERLGIVLVSPLASLDAVTGEDPWVFRACFSNRDQADALVRFQMEKYGAASCGILYDPRYRFSRELADDVQARMVELKGRVTGKYSFVDADGAKDYAAPLKRLAEDNPDFIFAACYALEATEIIRAAKELGIGIRFCGPHTWDIELVFDASGTRLAGTAFASVLFEQEFSYRPFRAFFAAMEQAGMENPDSQAAAAYDAVTLIANALKKGETAEAVRQGMLETRRLPLATGRTSIGPAGEAIKPVLIRVVERRGGRLVPVYAERYDPKGG